jgi:hypothetical protein
MYKEESPRFLGREDPASDSHVKGIQVVLERVSHVSHTDSLQVFDPVD